MGQSKSARKSRDCITSSHRSHWPHVWRAWAKIWLQLVCLAINLKNVVLSSLLLGVFLCRGPLDQRRLITAGLWWCAADSDRRTHQQPCERSKSNELEPWQHLLSGIDERIAANVLQFIWLICVAAQTWLVNVVKPDSSYLGTCCHNNERLLIRTASQQMSQALQAQTRTNSAAWTHVWNQTSEILHVLLFVRKK